jgi:peptidyl-prolyl cis-trans isomerase A (cyclophilin A)
MRAIISMGLTVLLVAIAIGDEAKPEQTKKEAMKDKYVMVLMKTSMGDITLQLDSTKAPITVANFLRYADEKGYDGTIFHRVVPGFVVQGGGFNPDMTKRPTHEPIENEWENGLKNAEGTIAMARLGNQPNSATNQFFINLKDNFALDQPRDGAGYAVFGKVVEGMDVVNAIGNVKVDNSDPVYKDKPLKDVLIKEVSVISKPGQEKPVEKKAAEEMPKEKPDSPAEPK